MDQPAGLVRKHEGRHHFARPRRILAAAALAKPRDETVDGLAIGRKDLATGRSVGVQLLPERPVHVAAVLKRLPEAFGVGRRKLGHLWLRLIDRVRYYFRPRAARKRRPRRPASRPIE